MSLIIASLFTSPAAAGALTEATLIASPDKSFHVGTLATEDGSREVYCKAVSAKLACSVYKDGALDRATRLSSARAGVLTFENANVATPTLALEGAGTTLTSLDYGVVAMPKPARK